MKRFSLIVLSLILVLSIAGCQKSIETAASPKPSFSNDALHSSGSYSGDVNLHLISYSENDGEHTFTLSFLRANGLPLSELPKYEITMSENPSRLYVRAGITSFDCEELESVSDCSYYMADEGGYSVFCAQFASPIVFSVSEDANELTIQISPLAHSATTQYFITGTDEDLRDLGFTQAICDGRKVYIGSEAFDDELSAEAKMAELAMDQLFLTRISDGRLSADYLTNAQMQIAAQAPKIIGAGGNEITATLWAYGAKPICEYTDKTYLFSKLIAGEESLYVYSMDGTGLPLENAPKGRCIKAKLHPEGTYAAFIMEAGGEYRLYAYDIAHEKSIDLTSYGMGVLTSDIAWGDDDCLYAISGDSSYQTIMKFDPAAHAYGQNSVSTIGSEDIMNGQLFAGAGRLYYLKDKKIYTCLLSGSSKIELIDADSFLVSPNGKYIAVQSFDEEGDGNFSIYDVENAKDVSLYDGETLSYVFSRDSGILYFTHQSDEADAPAKLISYNIMEDRDYDQSFMNTDIVFPMPSGNAAITLYLTDGTPVTYTINCVYN